MLIVVEGPDASGKSTLLERIRTEIPRRYFVIVRHSCRPRSALDVHRFLNLVQCEEPDTIVDRHPLISEPIYGPLLRKHDLTAEVFTPEAAVNWMRATVNRIIYCRPPDGVIKDNLGEKPQLAGVRENIDVLMDLYDMRMDTLARANIPVLPYDYSDSRTVDYEKLFFGRIAGR